MQEAAATDCADTAETGLHAANSSTSNISTRPPQEQQQQRQVASTGGDKLSTILAYLDAVEASVEGDVGAGAHTRCACAQDRARELRSWLAPMTVANCAAAPINTDDLIVCLLALCAC